MPPRFVRVKGISTVPGFFSTIDLKTAENAPIIPENQAQVRLASLMQFERRLPPNVSETVMLDHVPIGVDGRNQRPRSRAEPDIRERTKELQKTFAQPVKTQEEMMNAKDSKAIVGILILLVILWAVASFTRAASMNRGAQQAISYQ